jgi:aspartate aminotransferase-like enzyme
VRKRGFVMSNGYGKLKDQTFRIGHMGDHRMERLEELFDAIRGFLDGRA